MPDTLTPEELRVIRERYEALGPQGQRPQQWVSRRDLSALLRHLDALTAAVERKIEAASYHRNYRQACIDILAILNEEPHDA
jgi:hypothetical protein